MASNDDHNQSLPIVAPRQRVAQYDLNTSQQTGSFPNATPGYSQQYGSYDWTVGIDTQSDNKLINLNDMDESDLNQCACNGDQSQPINSNLYPDLSNLMSQFSIPSNDPETNHKFDEKNALINSNDFEDMDESENEDDLNHCACNDDQSQPINSNLSNIMSQPFIPSNDPESNHKFDKKNASRQNSKTFNGGIGK